MKKIVLLLVMLVSFVFSADKVDGLLGLKLKDKYIIDDNNVSFFVEKKENNSVQYFMKNVPSPIFIFDSIKKNENFNYVVTVFKDNIVDISAGFSFVEASDYQINDMFRKIKDLKIAIANKYNITFTDEYITYGEDGNVVKLSKFERKDNKAFDNTNQYVSSFIKDEVVYTLFFSYSKGYIFFTVNVSDSQGKAEMKKLEKDNLNKSF